MSDKFLLRKGFQKNVMKIVFIYMHGLYTYMHCVILKYTEACQKFMMELFFTENSTT